MLSAGGDGHRREKVRIIEEMFLPGIRVSLVARRHGTGGNQIFTSRRLMALIPRTTPVNSPQSNGITEAFVRP